MLLSDRDIWAELESGSLSFIPELDPTQVGPGSIDLHLDKAAKLFRRPPPGYDEIDLSRVSSKELLDYATEEIDLTGGVYLDRNDFVIGYTQEKVSIPPHLGGRVEGKSGWARLGLSIHNTAPTIQPGWTGQIALELSNNGFFRLKLSPGILICQLLLERLTSEPISGYEGGWQGQTSSSG